jgi:hypothetical protein
MMRRLIFLVMGCLLIPVVAEAANTTYYVDKSIGSDSNTGTSQTAGFSGPFSTVKKCIETATSQGDTCLIKNGTYPESPTLITWSGALDNPITIKNFVASDGTKHSPKIVQPTGTGTTTTDPHLQWLNIHPRPFPPTCNTVGCGLGTGGTQPGHFIIEGLEVEGFYNILHVAYAHDIVVRKNHWHHSYSQAILAVWYNVVVDGNMIHDTHPQLLVPDNGYGIYSTGKNQSIVNNIFWNTNTNCVHAAGYQKDSDPDTRYYGWTGKFSNNTCAFTRKSSGIVVFRQSGDPSNPSDTTLYNYPADMQPIDISNNIFYQNCTDNSLCAVGTGRGPYGVRLYDLPGVGATVRNNFSFNTKTSTSFFIRSDSVLGNFPGDPSTWATLSGNQDPEVSPDFVSVSTSPPAAGSSPDFHLASNSAAINFGLNLFSATTVTGATNPGITTDRDGNARPSSGAFEAGAYEFGAGGG